MARKPEYITIGRFGRPRGVSGDLYIIPATDDPERFLELSEIVAVGEGKRKKLQFESVEIIGGRPVARVKGVRSREEATLLTNLSIEIPIEQVRALPEGSYYQFDLVGCKVVGTDGTDYGVIEEILFYPASDLYRIKSERFGEVLMPVVDRFVVEIDVDARRVVIQPPDGLFVPPEDSD